MNLIKNKINWNIIAFITTLILTFIMYPLIYIWSIKSLTNKVEKNTSKCITINYNEMDVEESNKSSFLDSLKQEINKYPFRFPELILTQAISESGNFSSRLFREQNNLFGMKVPNKRLTTGVRGKNGFLQFETWQSSVLDRFIFECTYLSKFKDRKSYIEYLNKNYGTNINYLE